MRPPKEYDRISGVTVTITPGLARRTGSSTITPSPQPIHKCPIHEPSSVSALAIAPHQGGFGEYPATRMLLAIRQSSEAQDHPYPNRAGDLRLQDR
jgi:hypothetical protein